MKVNVDTKLEWIVKVSTELISGIQAISVTLRVKELVFVTVAFSELSAI